LRIEQAFLRRAEELGLDHTVVHPDPAAPRAVVEELLDAHPGLTGIVLSTSHETAESVPRILARRGLRAPDDLSIVAVGMTPDPSRPNLPFDAWPLDPALTCPVAVERLVGLIEGTTAPG